MSVRNNELQCEVHHLTYDFENRVGGIYFPAMNCCDMNGCIAMFKRIDDGVAYIQTYVGVRREKDTAYKFNGKTWSAIGGGYREPKTVEEWIAYHKQCFKSDPPHNQFAKGMKEMLYTLVPED